MTCCCKTIKYKFRNYLKFAVTKTEVQFPVSSDRFYFNISSSLKEHKISFICIV